MRRSWVVIASTLFLPCCLLVTSLDGLSGTTADAGDANVAGETTGASDSSNADAIPDAAAPKLDAARFCGVDAGQVFCSDFDDGPLPGTWDGFGTGVGTLSLQGDGSVSPPFALTVDLPTTTAYEDGASLTKLLTKAFSAVSCSFWVRRDLVGDARIIIASMFVETGAGDYELTVYMEAVGAGYARLATTLGDGGTPAASKGAAPLGFNVGEFHQVTMELKLGAASLSIDGTLATSLSSQGVSARPFRAKIAIGGIVLDVPNASPWRLRFDDVRCLMTP